MLGEYSEPSSPCSSSVTAAIITDGVAAAARWRRLRRFPGPRRRPCHCRSRRCKFVGPRRVGLDAQMIPMRGVEHVVVRPLAPPHHADDVARLQVIEARVHRRGELEPAHRHRFEAAFVGREHQRVEVHAGVGEHSLRDIELDPAVHRHAVGRGRSRCRDRACVPNSSCARPASHRLRDRVVHDDDAGRALPRGLLEFIGPAPVIGHGAALEETFVVRNEARIVDEQNDDFALHIDAGVVVPLVFGRVTP